MNVVILQPSYLPWRGYFHLIQQADIFVFYDDVQYDEHGWRNRNQIKTAQGAQWLSVPVLTKGIHTNAIQIKDVVIQQNKPWRTKHWRTIEQNYRRAPYFEQFAPMVADFYKVDYEHLADLTVASTILIARTLGLTTTRFLRSSQLPSEGGRTNRLISLLKHLGATRYISGPSGANYIEPQMFSAAGIELKYMEYDYPAYPQLYGSFVASLSVIDLLFNVGERSGSYIWSTPSVMSP